MNRCVLDASAVLAWLFSERGADTVEKVMGASSLSAVKVTGDEAGRTLRLGIDVHPFR
jgi:PIN domain nuclease of toxin-antitoxin system